VLPSPRLSDRHHCHPLLSTTPAFHWPSSSIPSTSRLEVEASPQEDGVGCGGVGEVEVRTGYGMRLTAVIPSPEDNVSGPISLHALQTQEPLYRLDICVGVRVFL
jgi:hypothetical protein